MTEKNVLTEIREDIIIAILNRPDALNALNDDLMDELSKIVEQYEENTDLKCLILNPKSTISFKGCLKILPIFMWT